jgi:two-component system CheB/CheR fusion protein
VPEVKQKILFTAHNLLNEHPFTKMDLISCRNLLIYINAKEQKRITDILRFSLNIGGFLFLGPSEGLTSLEPDLVVHNALWKLYKKNRNSHLPQVSTALHDRFLDKKSTSSSQSSVPSGSLPLYAYNAILQDVVAAGFIIDAMFVIQHSVGKAREMIKLPEGTPCLVLTKIIVDELKSTLIAALHEAKHALTSVQYHDIILHQVNEKQQNLNLTVHPIFDMTNKITNYWVRFEPVKKSRRKKLNLITHDAQNDDHHRDIIITLEKELCETRTLLESSLENMETVNEEMQSTNEELVASNEEMQSTNEELQSVNEELTTANLERTKKIEEVIQTKTDIDNLIRGAEICTIILNNKLEIRIFTPSIEKIFNLVSHDIGRALKNFKHNLQDDHFMMHVEDVLVHNIAYQAEVKNNKDPWYYLKIIPYYNPHGQSANGVVVMSRKV